MTDSDTKTLPVELRDTHSAAKFLVHSPRTLERWRIEGRGPTYVRCGKKILYTNEALLEFVARNTISPEAAA